jgi:hypothetical protein
MHVRHPRPSCTCPRDEGEFGEFKDVSKWNGRESDEDEWGEESDENEWGEESNEDGWSARSDASNFSNRYDSNDGTCDFEPEFYGYNREWHGYKRNCHDSDQDWYDSDQDYYVQLRPRKTGRNQCRCIPVYLHRCMCLELLTAFHC